MLLIMVRDQQLNTRITPEAYKALLAKCSEAGCSTYKYLRQLVHENVGVPEDPQENSLGAPAPGQTELKEKNGVDESRITIHD